MKVLKEWRYRHGKLYSECISRKESYIGSGRVGNFTEVKYIKDFHGSKIYKAILWE